MPPPTTAGTPINSLSTRLILTGVVGNSISISYFGKLLNIFRIVVSGS